MSELSLREAFDCLGVAPEAGLVQVRRAYQERLTLYGEDALASYSLLEPEERRDRLERIEAAYRKVVRELNGASGAVVALTRPAATTAPVEEAAPVDPARSPGVFLQRARVRAGVSLQEIARRTKLGTMKLTNIEEERFDQLPAPVYLRGFVDQYARLVGLPDPARIAELYVERCCQLQECG